MIASGEIYCWGDNQFNQISDESQLEYPLAIEVDVGADLRPFEITAGSGHTCIFLEEGRNTCLWSISYGFSENIDASGIRGVASVDGFSCGVEKGGEVFCFGSVDTEQRNTLPKELVTNIVPSIIKKGTIAGIPLENLYATYSILTDSENPLKADLRVEIDFGQDTDGDGWKDETEVACKSDPAEITSIPQIQNRMGFVTRWMMMMTTTVSTTARTGFLLTRTSGEMMTETGLERTRTVLRFPRE